MNKSLSFSVFASAFLALALLLVPSVALAQTAPSLDQMFANFSSSAVAFMNLVRWMALPVGLYISFRGLLSLKEYTESGGRVKLSTPIFLGAIGATLIVFPVATNIATETLALGAASGTQLSRVPSGGGNAAVAAGLEGVLLFVKLIGHISFFRGFLILKGVAEGAQQASVGRALTHILGGAACINIDTTIEVLVNTFAPGMFDGGGFSI